MAKEKKAQVKEDEEVLTPAVEVSAEAPAEVAPVVAAKKFPERVTPVVSRWGVPEFQVVAVGDQGRIYGKEGQPISGIISLSEASRTCSRHNALDPEQQAAKARRK